MADDAAPVPGVNTTDPAGVPGSSRQVFPPMPRGEEVILLEFEVPQRSGAEDRITLDIEILTDFLKEVLASDGSVVVEGKLHEGRTVVRLTGRRKRNEGESPRPHRAGGAWRRLWSRWPRYEAAAPTLLAAGMLGAVACGRLALAPFWVGFVVCYFTIAALVALAYTVNP